MHLTVLTLFPDLIEQVINESITGRARAAGLFSLKTIQIRDFAVNRYGKVDDACYGGGTGMLMMAEPVYHAWLAARAETPDLPVRTIHLSPRGKLFSQDMARELAASERPLVLLCGHYGRGTGRLRRDRRPAAPGARRAASRGGLHPRVTHGRPARISSVYAPRRLARPESS